MFFQNAYIIDVFFTDQSKANVWCKDCQDTDLEDKRAVSAAYWNLQKNNKLITMSSCFFESHNIAIVNVIKIPTRERNYSFIWILLFKLPVI